VSENLDLVRSIYADWERGDFTNAAWAHRDVEYVWVDGPTPGSWSGLIGMAEGARGIFNVWEDYRVEAHEYRELDDERVLVFTRMSGRGKASGLELEQMKTEGATVFHICDGEVTRHIYYWDRARALADLGLEE
jgi:ketosteroid isomerase-like protein